MSTQDANKAYWVYILANRAGMFYVGVTNDLERRMAEHRDGLVPGFASRYGLSRLVYFEGTTDIHAAIAREKQLKGWSRAKKAALIESKNPNWRDLACGDETFEASVLRLRQPIKADDALRAKLSEGSMHDQEGKVS